MTLPELDRFLVAADEAQHLRWVLDQLHAAGLATTPVARYLQGLLDIRHQTMKATEL